MSQNKTIVPGVDYDNLGNPDINNGIYSDLYSRSNGDDSNRTYVPGMQERNERQKVSSGVQSAMGDEPFADGVRMVTLQNRMVVGVLFSVSRGLLGEMFPLYLGRNIVGYTANCDVRLLENTVTSEHAIISIRKNVEADGYEVTITDYNSTYGTLVNNTDGRYETLTVQENDVITIGNHYQLLLKLFDIDGAHLQENAGFEAMPGGTQSLSESVAAQPLESGYTSDVSNDFYTPSLKDGDSSSHTVIS